MCKTRHLIAVLLTAALILSLLLPVSAYGAAGNVEDYDQVIAFVHTNDVHGAVDVEAYVPAVADALRAEYGEDNVIIANAGDTWGGATIASLSNGEYVAPIMNAAGYDVMTLGNDDIARGTDQALKVAAMNDFATLSANWMDAATDEHLMEGCTTFQCGEIKVGVFGLTTDDVKPDAAHPTYMADPDATVKECLAELEGENCDVVVALTHIGYGESYAFGSIYLADNYEGIDLIIDGHSHTELPEGHVGETGAMIVQTGQNGDNIGVSRIYLKDGEVVGMDTELISKETYTADYTPDAETAGVIEKYKAMVEEQTSQIVGATDTDLIGDREAVRTSETLLGDVIADAIRDYTGADAALYPSALIRSSLLTGDLTLNDYLAVFGSGCDLFVVDSTGAELRQMLAFGMSKYPEQWMAFPQISGIRFTYNTVSGEITSLTWEDGTEIGDEDTFKLAIDLLFLDTRGIYDAAGKTPVISGQTDMSNVLIDYMAGEDYATPSGGRIIYTAEMTCPFPDVDEDDWFEEEASKAYYAGIVKGYEDGTFGGRNPVTREQFAAMAARTACLEESDASPFSDAAGRALEREIAAAYEAGIVNGYQGLFMPADEITRQDAMTIIGRLAEYMGIDLTEKADLSGFKDADQAADYARDYIAALAAKGIVKGDGEKLNPKSVLSRAEAAALLVRVLELQG